MDPHRGGDLNDMAVSGTKIPGDAGKMNTIRSVPRPDQIDGGDASNFGGVDLAQAADNQGDMPRANKDIGATGEVMTGTGDALGAEVESKRLHFAANEPLSKGHERYGKHSRQQESDLERYAKEGAEVEAVPGEEGLGGTQGRDERGL